MKGLIAAALLLLVQSGLNAASLNSEQDFNGRLAQVHAILRPRIKDIQFSRAEFVHFTEQTIAQGLGTANEYLKVRDQSCKVHDENCIASLRGLAGQFRELTRRIDAFNSFSLVLLRPEVVSTLTDDEKRDIRHRYAAALKSLAIPVVGLDDLLNMKWGGYWTRRRIDGAQEELYGAVEQFDNDRYQFTLRVKAIIIPFPAPSPARPLN